MAKTTEAATPLTEPTASSRSKKRWWLIVAAVAMLAIGAVAGAVVFRGALRGTPSMDRAESGAAQAVNEEPRRAEPAVAPGPLYDLDAFIVNLADAPDVRYLRLTVKLELERPEVSAEVAARVPQIRDAVLILLSGKESTGLRSTQGKFQLRDEITQRINAVLPHGGVKTVYFTEFVVQ